MSVASNRNTKLIRKRDDMHSRVLYDIMRAHKICVHTAQSVPSDRPPIPETRDPRPETQCQCINVVVSVICFGSCLCVFARSVLQIAHSRTACAALLTSKLMMLFEIRHYYYYQLIELKFIWLHALDAKQFMIRLSCVRMRISLAIACFAAQSSSSSMLCATEISYQTVESAAEVNFINDNCSSRQSN